MMAAAPGRRGLRVRLDSVTAGALLVLLGGTALAAYNVGGVPIQWLAQALLAAFAILWVLLTRRLSLDGTTAIFGVFVAWSCFVSFINLPDHPPMPAAATMPYGAFVVLRYLSVLAFAGAFLMTSWACSRGQARRILRGVVWLGIAVSIAAIYIHLALWLGFPEPPRSRLGTGGGIQATVFSSGSLAYRRALGTFREPAHMAEWLLLPFFSGVAIGGRLGLASAVITGLALVLTISLTGLLSAAAGFIGGLWLMNPLRRRNLVRLGTTAVTVIVGALALSRVSIGRGDEALDVSTVIWRRFQDFAAGGLAGSSRAVWTQLFAAEGAPIVGHGLGNSNLVASRQLGSDLVVSYVSLYINVLYSAGVIGLTLLTIFLIRPLFRRDRWRPGATRAAQGCLMAYIAYLVAFMGASEELTVPFGFAAGLLHYYQQRPVRPVPSCNLDVPDRHAVPAGNAEQSVVQQLP
jgi:hypothetical protein